MEEIANAGPSAAESLQASVECIVELLESLQILASGNFEESIISNQVTDVVNSRYSTLKESDYTGPLTYQSMSRLPAPYR
jgi:brefeldin A-inhibited guanine nucleotide-exchange protein 3